MRDDDLLGFLLGCKCPCPPKETPPRPGGNLFRQKGKGLPPEEPPDLLPFIPPSPPSDPLDPLSPPLLVRAGLPHVALLPSPDLWLTPSLPPDHGEGYRSPQGPPETEPRLWFGDRRVASGDPLPVLDHYALRLRPTVRLPYASGIQDGLRYVRVLDVPVGEGDFFLRRDPGRWVPYQDGVAWATPTAEALSLWRENPALQASVSYVVPTTRNIVFGVPAVRHGKELWHGNVGRETVGSAPARSAMNITAQGVMARMIRVFEDGTTLDEAPVSAVDLTYHSPAFPDLEPVTREMWISVWSEFSDMNVNVYYLGGSFTADFRTRRVTQEVGPGFFAWATGQASIASNYAVTDERDLPMGGGGIDGASFTALGLPGQTQGLAADPDLGEDYPVRIRYWRDAQGEAALWQDAPLTAGRVVYEGPLGVLPAPRSGLSSSWCDLTFTASQDFTADAWQEGSRRAALIVFADGTALASVREGEHVSTWSGTLAELVDVPPTSTPVLGYAFMIPGWPAGAGDLVWTDDQGVTRLRARLALGAERRTRDPGRSRPVLLLPGRVDGTEPPQWSGQVAPGHLLPGGRSVPPASADRPPPFLGDLQRPAPHEPGGGKHPLLLRITDPLTLTFMPGWTAPVEGGTRLESVEYLTRPTSLEALRVPDGWTRRVTRPDGRGWVAVTLTPPAPSTDLSITFTPPRGGALLGHVRARLRPTGDP